MENHTAIEVKIENSSETTEFDEQISNIQNFVKQQKNDQMDFFYITTCDLGGTNCRVSFCFYLQKKKEKQSFVPADVPNTFQTKCKCAAEFYIFLDLIHSLTEKFLPPSDAGVIAAAGPPLQRKEKITITNFLPDDNVIFLNKCNFFLFPRRNSIFLGDVEACCFGIIDSNSHLELHNYFDCLHSASDESKEHSTKEKIVKLRRNHYCVLLVGTGLFILFLIEMTESISKISKNRSWCCCNSLDVE